MSEGDPSKIRQSLPDDETLRWIGEVALRHAHLDNQLRMMVGDLVAFGPNQALNATHRQGSNELRKRIISLGKRRLGECREFALLQDLMTQCERVTARRNALLHAIWGEDIEVGGYYLRDEDNVFQDAPNLLEIRRIAEDIRDLLYATLLARKNGFLQEALAKKPISLGVAQP